MDYRLKCEPQKQVRTLIEEALTAHPETELIVLNDSDWDDLAAELNTAARAMVSLKMNGIPILKNPELSAGQVKVFIEALSYVSEKP